MNEEHISNDTVAFFLIIMILLCSIILSLTITTNTAVNALADKVEEIQTINEERYEELSSRLDAIETIVGGQPDDK